MAGAPWAQGVGTGAAYRRVQPGGFCPRAGETLEHKRRGRSGADRCDQVRDLQKRSGGMAGQCRTPSGNGRDVGSELEAASVGSVQPLHQPGRHRNPDPQDPHPPPSPTASSVYVQTAKGSISLRVGGVLCFCFLSFTQY